MYGWLIAEVLVHNALPVNASTLGTWIHRAAD